MSILAIIGVVVSAAAMIIVLSGFSGLKNYSLAFVSSVSPKLKISPKQGKVFDFTPAMEVFLKDKGLEYTSVIENKALLSLNGNRRIINIKGVDESFPKETIDSILYQGSWFKTEGGEVVVGWGSAYDLGISTLDALNPISIYVPRPGKGQVFSEKDVLKSKKVLASGIFSINEDLNNRLVFVPLKFAKELFSLDERKVGSIEVFNKALSKKSVEEISLFFGSDFLLENQIQQNRSLYKMLNTEQVAVYLIFSLIVIVALFNMFGALIMVFIEKRENLHTLMFLGLTKNNVGKIFFYQGLLISLFGCIVGLLFGALLIFLQKKLSLLMISPSLAYPVVFEIKNFIIVFATVLVFGGIASSIVFFYVKKRVSRISQQ